MKNPKNGEFEGEGKEFSYFFKLGSSMQILYVSFTNGQNRFTSCFMCHLTDAPERLNQPFACKACEFLYFEVKESVVRELVCPYGCGISFKGTSCYTRLNKHMISKCPNNTQDATEQYEKVPRLRKIAEIEKDLVEEKDQEFTPEDIDELEDTVKVKGTQEKDTDSMKTTKENDIEQNGTGLSQTLEKLDCSEYDQID